MPIVRWVVRAYVLFICVLAGIAAAGLVLVLAMGDEPGANMVLMALPGVGAVTGFFALLLAAAVALTWSSLSMIERAVFLGVCLLSIPPFGLLVLIG